MRLYCRKSHFSVINFIGNFKNAQQLIEYQGRRRKAATTPPVGGDLRATRWPDVAAFGTPRDEPHPKVFPSDSSWLIPIFSPHQARVQLSCLNIATFGNAVQVKLVHKRNGSVKAGLGMVDGMGIGR